MGTRICVSSSTVEKCRHLQFRPIGSLMLQGKTQMVDAFEPVDLRNFAPRFICDYHDAYQLLESDGASALNLFAKLNTQYPDDALVTLHLSRLTAGLEGKEIVLNMK